MADQRDFDVLSRNLRLIDGRQHDLAVLRKGQYREALRLMAESDEAEKGSAPTDRAVQLFRGLYGDAPLCSHEFARLCVEFGACFGDRLSLRALLPKEEQEPSGELNQTVYVRNGYTDRAYRRFSQTFERMRSAYSPGYSSACEEVYYGRSTHVILPVYSSRDGILITFRRMLRKYDLKLSSACPIEMETGETVYYALAQKGIPTERADYLDGTFVIPDGVTTAEFLGICEGFGLSISLINTMPEDDTAGFLVKNELGATFFCKNADVTSFVFFLNASHTRHNIEGLYNILV